MWVWYNNGCEYGIIHGCEYGILMDVSMVL